LFLGDYCVKSVILKVYEGHTKNHCLWDTFKQIVCQQKIPKNLYLCPSWTVPRRWDSRLISWSAIPNRGTVRLVHRYKLI